MAQVWRLRTASIKLYDIVVSSGGVETKHISIQSNLSLRTPLFYGQFVWSQKCQKSYIPYLYNTDTSVKRTLGSVPLVSVLKRFDCINLIARKIELTYFGFAKCLRISTDKEGLGKNLAKIDLSQITQHLGYIFVTKQRWTCSLLVKNIFFRFMLSNINNACK